MKFTPYLTFDGNAAEAFRYYARVLGGDLEIMTFADAPLSAEQACPGGELAEEWRSKVMHACLTVGSEMLMGSDAPPQFREERGGFSVSIHVDDPKNASRIFDALADGGVTTMPLGETFWAQRFGMCKDRFGTAWMINCPPAV